jgi:hypothetical protein
VVPGVTTSRSPRNCTAGPTRPVYVIPDLLTCMCRDRQEQDVIEPTVGSTSELELLSPGQSISMAAWRNDCRYPCRERVRFNAQPQGVNRLRSQAGADSHDSLTLMAAFFRPSMFRRGPLLAYQSRARLQRGTRMTLPLMRKALIYL